MPSRHLIASLAFSTACSLLLGACYAGGPIPVEVTIDNTCQVEPVRFQDETKAWITRDGEPPHYVTEDLDRVAKNNEVIEEVCGENADQP